MDMLASVLQTYFLVGACIYTFFAVMNRKSFRRATLSGVLRGLLLGFVLWPLLPYVLYRIYRLEKN